MRVAIHHSFAVNKKEPLAEMVDRIRQAFLDAGMVEPTIRFTLIDSPMKKGVSIDRVLKRHPEMEQFLTSSTLPPRAPTASRMLTNVESGEAAEYSTIQAILAGVP